MLLKGVYVGLKPSSGTPVTLHGGRGIDANWGVGLGLELTEHAGSN